MKIINGYGVCLDYSDLDLCGINTDTLTTGKRDGTGDGKYLIKDPEDRRKNLLPYSKASDVNRKKIDAVYGSLADFDKKQPLLNMIVHDNDAADFFYLYRLEGKKLADDKILQLVRAASIMNVVTLCKNDWRTVKQQTGYKDKSEFFEVLTSIIKHEIENGKKTKHPLNDVLPGDFPASYPRLLKKHKQYEADKYQSLISKKAGNKNAAKLTQEQLSVIEHIASKHNNFNAAQVKQLADKIFIENGWQTVHVKTIRTYIKANNSLLMPGSRGRREYDNKVAMQHKRKAPAYPGYYWTLDGWTVELLYQDKERYDNRLVMVLVLDAMNKYPVGYAIGSRENAELIKDAVRNAISHMRELFGDCYYPWQLQSDNYQVKHLTPFYHAASHWFTPAAVGNAKAKVIEPYFRYLNNNYCQFMPNWSGHNIDAKKANQPNREYLNKIKSTFPDKQGLIKQIQWIISQERKLKSAEYIEKWNQLPAEDKLIMLDENRLKVFGETIGRTNLITGGGIIKEINGVSYCFDSFDPAFRKHSAVNWKIIADTNNLDKVLAVSEDGRLEFLLEQKHIPSMALKEQTPEDREYYSKIEQYNKDRELEIIERYDRNANVTYKALQNISLIEDAADATALKLMFITNGEQKEAIQDAKRLKQKKATEARETKKQQQAIEDNWQEIQEAYMRSQTDFDKYRD